MCIHEIVRMITLCPCNVSLIVDVKLSSVKTAKIQIWRGDDPSELAHSFGRIYSLDQKARELLVTVIRQSMVDNGLVPQLEEASYAYSEAPDGPYDGGFQGNGSRDFGDAYLGDDAQFVEDYDSQSSVSDSNDMSQSDVSSESGGGSVGSASTSDRGTEPTA
jgi:hypothetical protein